ncbi:hypothetical protein ANN_22394 [Periplaneta americana]|uniref:Uncharacterized protein n=1 Tax=Periplaneta americana TaxID=6978 RepID=A0ABQ8S808_PERAM|nr:hypothetical protein ANN_22394 [Periplaneta americana]
MGESRNAYRVIIGRPKEIRPLGRPRLRWEDNITVGMRQEHQNVEHVLSLRCATGVPAGVRYRGYLASECDEGDNAGEMSPESNTESYPAFADIGLRENPGKNLKQVTCPDRESNPDHLVSRPDGLTVTPEVWTNVILEEYAVRRDGSTFSVRIIQLWADCAITTPRDSQNSQSTFCLLRQNKEGACLTTKKEKRSCVESKNRG